MTLLARMGIPQRMREALVPYWGIRWDLLEEIQMLLTLVCQRARTRIDAGEDIRLDLMMEAVRDMAQGSVLPDITLEPVITSDSATTVSTEEEQQEPPRKKAKPLSA